MILERWKQCGVFIAGRDHIRKKEECQDRTFYLTSNSTHVIALADGAGSKKNSQYGADIVTKKICSLVSENFIRYFMLCEETPYNQALYDRNMKTLKKEIIESLLIELKQYAIQNNVGIDDLSSTLLFVALHGNQYILGHIGDGVIGGLFSDNQMMSIDVLSSPHNGAAPNITFFLTDVDAIDNLRIKAGEFNNLKGIILMSDGVEEVLYNKNIGLVDNTKMIFSNFKMIDPKKYELILKRFLDEKIASYSSDDLSINIMYLESLDTREKVTPEYVSYFLSGIYSKSQLINRSAYCITLNQLIKADKKDFSDYEELRRYLQWI